LFTDGKLLLVKVDELTIPRGHTPIVIPKAVISKSGWQGGRGDSQHTDGHAAQRLAP